MMVYSQTGLHLTQQFERCILKAYQDQGGVWTIGYGHTLGVRAGDVCTLTQALLWLQSDIQAAAYVVNHLVRVPLTQAEFDALVDFVFNIGPGNFMVSTLLEKLNRGDYAGAAAEFPKWDFVKGAKCRGLFLRRVAEQQEFAGVQNGASA